MRETDPPSFESLRLVMLAVIAAHAKLCAQETGRETLDQRVMAAIARVPRHDFVPEELQPFAYEDTPLPIGYGKTISQPFMVALMTDLLEIRKSDVVLEVGTGLGYQAAILAELAAKVFSVEIVEELATEAKRRLTEASYTNIEARVGDGSRGWVEHSPFDKIIVTAAPELIPRALLQQLKPGGKVVIPAGTEGAQKLLLVDKAEDGELQTREVMPVLFSRMTLSH